MPTNTNNLINLIQNTLYLQQTEFIDQACNYLINYKY